MQAELDDEGVHLLLEPPRYVAVESMAVGLDPGHESELTSPNTDGEKVRMGQRLAAAENDVQGAETAQALEDVEVLLLLQRPAAQRQVVVAKIAVEVAAIGQLQESREEQIALPRFLNNARETHSLAFPSGRLREFKCTGWAPGQSRPGHRVHLEA
jgi:hypothetical protein